MTSGIAADEAYTYSGDLPATDGACITHGPFAIGAGNRALDGFAAATVPLNDLVLELWKDGVLLVHADTLFSPEQFHYEPAGGVVAGNYEIKVCDFADGAPWDAPRTYSGTLTGDSSPLPPAYLARWKTFPANPPLYTVHGYPWNFPDTDTREVWCWVGAAGCDRVIGNLASRGPWDHDHKLNAPTLTTRGNNAKSATSWVSDILPSAPQYMPVSATRDYSYPWTNSWNNDECEPTPNGPPGATWDDSAATVNLFVAHNRVHDFSYFLGFTERTSPESSKRSGFNGLPERKSSRMRSCWMPLSVPRKGRSMPIWAAASSSSGLRGRGRESRADTGRSFSSGAGNARCLYTGSRKASGTTLMRMKRNSSRKPRSTCWP